MRSNFSGTIASIIVAVIGVVLLAIFKGASVELSYPVERIGKIFSRRIIPYATGFFGGARAKRENVRLKREVASLAMVNIENDRLAAENRRLRQLLDYSERTPGDWVAAAVLSAGGGAAGVRNILRVDKGSIAGIKEGMIVAVPEGLVGIVESVTLHTATILSIVDTSLKVSCIVEGEHRAHGILSGGTEERLAIEHLSVDGAIAPQSRVFTSGIGGVFPANIPVGRYIGAESDAEAKSAAQRRGYVEPAVDFGSLEDVFIRREK